MRLNPDCIRDILIFIEDNSTPSKVSDQKVCLNDMLDKFNYPIEALIYHAQQLEMDSLITNISDDFTGNFYVKDLTPDGHRFLANIRNDNSWSKTKEITRSIGGFSIQMLKNVSESVIVALVKNKLGL
ncbi:DUF2513 domain-containing protein [Ligilactobacillus animalis]|uniref:DUF2513 domain-containing protein n=1 Tax=Ligilactobacillus animalis TaxID=1605 RepID=A0AAJ6K3L1_9LACO|nr:DUF2513 domain-containing protein [Ligilactobacillus animalis]WHQ80632.1 DUF2513 domain-containing protein [Ligilactobacillus animalis]